MFGTYDILTISLLILAIAINSLSVYVQKRFKFYERFGRNAYVAHNAIIAATWGLFIISEFLAARSSWRLENSYTWLGYGIMVAALGIFILAIRQIGPHALGNGNFFGKPERILGGIYRYVPEPIYTSYCLWFVGIGLASSLKVFFVLAAVAFVGLIFIESRIERPV